MGKRRNISPDPESFSPKLRKVLVTKKHDNESVNIFGILHVIEHVAEKLSVQDLVNLSQAHSEVKEAILNWILSSKSNEYMFAHFKANVIGRGHFVLGNSQTRLYITSIKECLDHMKDMGKLLNNLTLDLPISLRLSMGSKLISPLQLQNSRPRCIKSSKPARSVNTVQCCIENYKLLLEISSSFGSSFVSNWAENDSQVAFDYIFDFADVKFNLRTQLKTFVTKPYVVGTDGEMEFKLKHALLNFFWTHFDDEAKPQWLQRLLYLAGDTRSQALILYLMFGPVLTVKYHGSRLEWIMWDEPVNLLDYNDDMQKLGQVLSCLHDNDALTLELMETIMKSPNDDMDVWSDQSIAQLLHFMSPESREWFLLEKQSHGNLTSKSENPVILAHLLIVASSMETDNKVVHTLIQKCYEYACPNHKKHMIESIWHELATQLMDVTTLPSDDVKAPILKAVTDFGLSLMQLAFIDNDLDLCKNTENMTIEE